MIAYQDRLRRLTVEEFAALGRGQIAYLRPVEVNGRAGIAAHDASGQPLLVAEDPAGAIAALVQHDIHPVTLH